MLPTRYRNRTDAGRHLAESLCEYAGNAAIVVLALPRGGVPVAVEVAKSLRAPLHSYIVRKIGVPGHEELAMGAVASDGTAVVDRRVVRALDVSSDEFGAAVHRELAELRRREWAYRDGRREPDLSGKTVIVIDDGLATGSTMRAAVTALRRRRPAAIVVAVPTAARRTCDELARVADRVVCLSTPEPFEAVGRSYDDFSQTSDEEVRTLLRRAADMEAKRWKAGTHLAHALVPLTGGVRDDETLFDLVGNASLVLIGESTCGTHDFHRARAEITKRLIGGHGFTAVCIESDWTGADRVNRYVRGASSDGAAESLGGFTHFPEWTWRNAEIAEFVAWLREYNDAAAVSGRVEAGFYGLDLYGTHASIEFVLTYLESVDTNAAARTRRDFERSEPLEPGSRPICRDDIVAELLENRRRALPVFPADGNAGAEEYYRAMLDETARTWNRRDAHMVDTLRRLIGHFASTRGCAKTVVWTHNAGGETNLGALVRRAFGEDAVSIGFTTYTGTVTAAARWRAPAEQRLIAPARGDSYEYLFHSLKVPRLLLPLRPHRPKLAGLPQQARERAIGAVYDPQNEPSGNYFTARLIEQFDAVYHFDVTRALDPLEVSTA